jgi:hypothetical protein
MSRLLVLIVFMLLMWLPMAQMLTGLPRQTVAVDENRKLAPKPGLRTWGDMPQFADDTVKWFNDHFGFRDFLIRSKTQIDYSVFGISTRIHVGSDGWLFYRSVMDVEKPQIELTLRKDADAVIEGTRQLATVLAERGVKLIIMVAPMKDVYYSAHLPNTAKKLPDPRQVELLQDRFRAMKEIIFIDSEAILKETAKHRTVFHKTDFHWNDPAAFDVARSLVNALGKYEGKANPVWAHQLEIEEKLFSGGEAAFMPIFFPPKEQGLFVKQNWVTPAFDYKENNTPFEWIYEMKEPSGRELSPITVVGDSFFDGMSRSGMGVYFKKIYKAKWAEINVTKLAKNLPVDSKYLLLEFIEVSNGAYSELMSANSAK